MSADEEYNAVNFDIAQFLAEYEQLPELWNCRHQRFKDSVAKSTILSILGVKFGISDVNTLKRKIRSIRGSYNTEIRKMKLSLGSEEGLHIPKLSWFPLADRFLRATTDLSFKEFPQVLSFNVLKKLPKIRHVQVITEHSDGNLEHSNGDSDLYKELEYLEEDDNTNTLKKEMDNSDSVPIEETIIYHCNTSDSVSNSERQPKRPKSELEDTVKYIKKLARTSENEFLTFGQSIGLQLQSLPLEVAIQLQMDIQAHVTKARLEYLNDSNAES